MPSIETYQLLLTAVAACEDKKAEDIRILALDPTESGLSDYFVICNGTNERQNVAITDEIEIRLKRDFGIYPNSVEGRRQAEWVLMDYVDFIVHVFSPEKRAYYGLERLRKSATTVSPDDLNTELKAQIRSSRSQHAAKKAAGKPAAKASGKSRTSVTPRSPAKTSPTKKNVGARNMSSSETEAPATTGKKQAGKKVARKISGGSPTTKSR